MGVVALVVAILLFVLAAFTDGIWGLVPIELTALGLSLVALALLVGIPPLPAWPRRD